MDWLFRSAEGLEAVQSDTQVGENLAERWQKYETNIRNKPANA